MDIRELIFLEKLNYLSILDVYSSIEYDKFDTMASVGFELQSCFYEHRLEFLSSYL